MRSLAGLRTTMPVFAGAMGVATFANLGLPGLAGFVGEFFIFRGVWASLPLFALLATIGLVVTALALLRMYGQMFHGQTNERSTMPDMRLAGREFLAVAPLLIALLILGIYPAPIMDLSNQTATVLARVFLP
jgi:NADH-quinone oxidoreductase subunit M